MRISDRLRHARIETEYQWKAFTLKRESQYLNPQNAWLEHSWQVSARSIDVEKTCAPIDDPEAVRQQFISSQLYQVAKPLLDDLLNSFQYIGFAFCL